MRLATILAGLYLTASVATPSLAAKSKAVNHAAPTWSQCFEISLDRGMNHEYEEWRQFIDDCVAGKIPLDAPQATQ